MTHLLHRAPPLSLHDCFTLFTHCTQRERERERESDRYYYYHGGAIMQRTQTAGSNWSRGLLILWNLGSSSDTNSIACKNVENSKKYLFQ